MFLLIRQCLDCSISKTSYLHSTMFLLIQGGSGAKVALFTFTFHNVSINSYSGGERKENAIHLHSTMFLLIRHQTARHFPAIYIYIPQCFY